MRSFFFLLLLFCGILVLFHFVILASLKDWFFPDIFSGLHDCFYMDDWAVNSTKDKLFDIWAIKLVPVVAMYIGLILIKRPLIIVAMTISLIGHTLYYSIQLDTYTELVRHCQDGTSELDNFLKSFYITDKRFATLSVLYHSIVNIFLFWKMRRPLKELL